MPRTPTRDDDDASVRREDISGRDMVMRSWEVTGVLSVLGMPKSRTGELWLVHRGKVRSLLPWESLNLYC